MGRGQAYTLDALAVASLTSASPVDVPAPTPAERVLGELLLRYEVQGAIYAGDARALRLSLIHI